MTCKSTRGSVFGGFTLDVFYHKIFKLFNYLFLIFIYLVLAEPGLCCRSQALFWLRCAGSHRGDSSCRGHGPQGTQASAVVLCGHRGTGGPPRAGRELVFPCIGGRMLSLWTTREVLRKLVFS